MRNPAAGEVQPSLEDDERAAVADAESGDTASLIQLLKRRGLHGVAELIAGSRIAPRKARGRPPIPGGSESARALAEAILRKQHLARYPITRPMSVAGYAADRWDVHDAGLSDEVVLFPDDTTSFWAAAITSAIGPSVDERTVAGGGSHQARAIVERLMLEPRPAGIAADRPAEIRPGLKPGGREATRNMVPSMTDETEDGDE
jgi:hypothetical protein